MGTDYYLYLYAGSGGNSSIEYSSGNDSGSSPSTALNLSFSPSISVAGSALSMMPANPVPLSIAKGGTGATTVAGAQTALSMPPFDGFDVSWIGEKGGPQEMLRGAFAGDRTSQFTRMLQLTKDMVVISSGAFSYEAATGLTTATSSSYMPNDTCQWVVACNRTVANGITYVAQPNEIIRRYDKTPLLKQEIRTKSPIGSTSADVELPISSVVDQGQQIHGFKIADPSIPPNQGIGSSQMSWGNNAFIYDRGGRVYLLLNNGEQEIVFCDYGDTTWTITEYDLGEWVTIADPGSFDDTDPWNINVRTKAVTPVTCQVNSNRIDALVVVPPPPSNGGACTLKAVDGVISWVGDLVDIPDGLFDD
jgi:hypothetical protein